MVERAARSQPKGARWRPRDYPCGRYRVILRQKWALALGHRAVAQSSGSCLARPAASSPGPGDRAGLASAPAAERRHLGGRLYGRPEVAGQRQRPAPDRAWIDAERRRPGVTLELLHPEYLERRPDGYRYTRLCDPRDRGRRGLQVILLDANLLV